MESPEQAVVSPVVVQAFIPAFAREGPADANKWGRDNSRSVENGKH